VAKFDEFLLMSVVYNFVITLYSFVISLMSPFKEKAGLWYQGRKGFFRKYHDFNKKDRTLIWIHCASLGEFEQGRPVIEEIKKRDETIFILLTFFSPSGLEIRKDYPLADLVCYLPADSPSNARRFIKLFNPDLAVFVKYEFWYNYLSYLKKNNIPLFLISANFRPDQIFFKWYGSWFSQMLHLYSHIFVQSESSLRLLNSAGIENVTVAGDTRFDRVYALASGSREIGVVADFSAGKFTLVAGSTWPADHDLLVRYFNDTTNKFKLIIAPHEINEKEIEKLAGRFNKAVLRYSASSVSDPAKAEVLIIDNIGILSSVYRYAGFAYIGGGFGRGIHNILEASTHDLPVVFGPNYRNFLEATELVGLGGAFPVNSYTDFSKTADELINDENHLIRAGRIAGTYVRSRIGATGKIVNKILIS
jgi:3-deoxy-D-manno-octulosonic-acid transferase